MAAVSVSGYVPLRRGLTSYSFWLSLNCFTNSFVASPSCPVMACQKWISVLAEAGAGARAATKSRAQAQAANRRTMVVRRMAFLLVTGGSIGLLPPAMLPEARVDCVAGSRILRIVALTAGRTIARITGLGI